MSAGDRKQILRTARNALATVGYSKEGSGEVFTKPVAEDVLGWVGLMTDPADDGVLEISPKVGVRHEQLHRFVDRVAGRDGSLAPTVSKVLGYLMPAGTANVVWRFDDPTLYDAQAENMIEAISDYGVPYMRRNIALDHLVVTLRQDGLWEYSQELIPVAHVLNGDPESAKTFIDAELRKLAGRDDPAADDFRTFAKSLRKELETRAL
jgi:hypothetical protein